MRDERSDLRDRTKAFALRADVGRVIYPVAPVPKPRMTHADRWKRRSCVVRYLRYKDAVREAGVSIPESGGHVVFVLPMPSSWSRSKREAMDGAPHQVRPDLDNLQKALLDALFTEDSRVWDLRASKVWGESGGILVLE